MEGASAAVQRWLLQPCNKASEPPSCRRRLQAPRPAAPSVLAPVLPLAEADLMTSATPRRCAGLRNRGVALLGVPPLPQWLRCEMSKADLHRPPAAASVLQSMHSTASLLSAMGSVAPAPKQLPDLKGLPKVAPQQVLFIQSQFGLGMLATSAESKRARAARLRREQDQLRKAVAGRPGATGAALAPGKLHQEDAGDGRLELSSSAS